MSIKEILGKQLIFADGAMGTQMQKAGLTTDDSPMAWNITHKETVRSIYEAYIEAGATYVTTNTFGASALKLKGLPYSVEEVVTASVELAREAIAKRGVKAFVALTLGPLGELLKPMGQLSFDEAVELFKQQVIAGVAAGADTVIMETMMDTYELKAAVLAAREASDVPIMASVAINEQGRMLNGADLDCVCALLEGLSVDAFGVNCGAGPQEIASYVEHLCTISSTPLIFCPNAGLPTLENGKAVYHMSPDEFSALMKPLAEGSLAIIGGCCGTTPAHIKALVDSYRDVVPKQITNKKRRVISSYAVTVDMDAEEVIIDRCIDPGKNQALAHAFANGDYEYAIDEAIDAISDGAQVLGVSAIASDIDEQKVLPALVECIQGMVKVPLLIISADLAALERALRIYNGCALINLGHFALEQMEAASALADYYGAVVM